MNPYLNPSEINEAFRKIHLEELHDFLEDDLQKMADAFIMAAMPAIVRTERAMCVKFVKSLNPEVARALDEYRDNL